jgi:hypothetical protein
MHDHIQADLEALGVEVIHNERVEDLDDLERERDDAARQEGREGKIGRRMVKTRLKSGAVIESDLQVRSNDFRIDVLLDTQIVLGLAQTADHLYRTETQPRVDLTGRRIVAERQGIAQRKVIDAARSPGLESCVRDRSVILRREVPG